MSDELERRRAEVQGRLIETYRGEPITPTLIEEIRATLPEGWTLNDWTVVEGELNISVTGPAPEEIVRTTPVHLSVVKDPEA